MLGIIKCPLNHFLGRKQAHVVYWGVGVKVVVCKTGCMGEGIFLHVFLFEAALKEINSKSS